MQNLRSCISNKKVFLEDLYSISKYELILDDLSDIIFEVKKDKVVEFEAVETRVRNTTILTEPINLKRYLGVYV